MTVRMILALLPLAAVISASAQTQPPIAVTMVRAGGDDDTSAILKQELKPDIEGCRIPDNQRFTAQVSLTVTRDGTPDRVALVKGSGNECLDDAALHAVKSATFYPATHKGRPIARGMVKIIDFVHYDEAHAPVEPSFKAPAGTTPPRVLRAPEPKFGKCRIPNGTALKTLVKIMVNTGGQLDLVSIVTSSGDACIDEAALKAVRGYVLKPAMRDGVAVPFAMNVEVNFQRF